MRGRGAVGELESIREIAARMVAEHRRKRELLLTAVGELRWSDKDRDWLRRIGIEA